MNNRVAVIIPAAGMGKRMGSDQAKQYIEVNGKPILVHTLECFEHCDAVDDIILVVESNQIEMVKETIVSDYGFNKVKAVIAGKDTRQASVYEGLKVLDETVAIVLVHDGARPMITVGLIDEAVKATKQHQATVMAVPVKDTIKVVDADGFIEMTPKRSSLYSIQTPQSFERKLLVEAYAKGMESGFEATDDAMMVEQFGGVKVKIIEGSYDNRKITTPDDLVWMKLMKNN